LVLALWWGGLRAPAAETVSPAEKPHPIFADPSPQTNVTPPPARPAGSSMVSPRISDMIKAKLPAYRPNGAAVSDDDPPTDAIKLPAVLVNAPKLKVPDDVHSLSRKGFAELLRKRYPGASLPGQDPYRIENGAPNYARMQFEEDRRKEQKASIESFATLIERTGDAAMAQKLRKELQRSMPGSTYKDPLLEAMDKSVNGGRR
jgi:hypothetical protein